MGQELRLCASTTVGRRFNPGGGTKIPYSALPPKCRVSDSYIRSSELPGGQVKGKQEGSQQLSTTKGEFSVSFFGRLLSHL